MNSENRKPVELTIRSDPTHLPLVRAVVEKACSMVGFDNDIAGSIVLSVDEALTNIIKHAYKGADDRRIDVEFEMLGAPPEGLQVRIRDYGEYVDPSQIKSRDLEDVRPGGLGVHIMTECMDRVQFTPAEGAGTLLTLTKRLPVKQET